MKLKINDSISSFTYFPTSHIKAKEKQMKLHYFYIAGFTMEYLKSQTNQNTT